MDHDQEQNEEQEVQERKPLQYKLYKGITGKFGSLRLTLKRAYEGGRRTKEDGCVFLEMAAATGPNVYNWEHKTIMALSQTDIPKIVLYLRDPENPIFFDKKDDTKAPELKIYHDRGAGQPGAKGKETSSLSIQKPANRDSFFFSSTQKKENEETRVQVPVSPDEALAIVVLLEAAIPQILAW